VPRPTEKCPVILPTQQRSKATFDAIVEATTYLIQEVGIYGITTNMVAERAGININSFYQYFFDKAAVIRWIAQQHIEENGKALQAAVEKALSQKNKDRLEYVIDEMLDLFSTRNDFRREIMMGMPLIVGPKHQQKVRRGFAVTLSQVMPDQKNSNSQKKLISSELLVHSFMGTIVVLMDPQFSVKDRQLYRQEIRSLLLKYCQG
jgi:AcrR family transcriptional regulator